MKEGCIPEYLKGNKLLEHAMKVAERIFEHRIRQQIDIDDMQFGENLERDCGKRLVRHVNWMGVGGGCLGSLQMEEADRGWLMAMIRQNPESRKMVVCMCAVCSMFEMFLIIIMLDTVALNWRQMRRHRFYSSCQQVWVTLRLMLCLLFSATFLQPAQLLMMKILVNRTRCVAFTCNMLLVGDMSP